MNKPAKVSFPTISPDYAVDGYGWAMAQTALMRSGSTALDWANIIEEIESVGKSELRSLESNLFQIALHLLKWDAQPSRRGNSWWHCIENHRDAAQKDLRKNPSLRPLVDELVREAVEDGKRRAARDTGLPETAFASLNYDVDALFERVIDRPEPN